LGRRLTVTWKEDIEELFRLYRKEKEPHRRTRFKALWFMQRGESLVEISDSLGIPYRSLQRWVKWYREEGIEAISKRIPGYKANGKNNLNNELEIKLLIKS
jgi:transposase